MSVLGCAVRAACPGSSGAEPGAGVGQAAVPVPAKGKATAFRSSGGWVVTLPLVIGPV